jgi:SulP family sulfate permease
VGQGAANIAVSFFRGMPVGGSISATSLVVASGARTRFANIFAGILMVIITLLFAGAVGRLAMPALAMRGGLLMHTWVYLAACEGTWLLYDIWWAFQRTSPGRTGSAVLEAIRIVAIGFAFAASVAQRRALTPVVLNTESWGETLEPEVAS